VEFVGRVELEFVGRVELEFVGRVELESKLAKIFDKVKEKRDRIKNKLIERTAKELYPLNLL
jgi:hypothetical protein